MTKEQQVVLVPDYLTVREVAELIDSSPIDVMKTLIANGIMASINQQIDFDTAAIVIGEMGYEAKSQSALEAEKAEQQRAEEMTRKWEQMYKGEKPEDLEPRPSVITILGHVDHGKTTLIDTIRKANVADGEAGGITQHIGAYQVKHDNQTITFLDTPGHEAFTAMRARGAQGADIAILVVAADDGVMPTTREALNHARAANVPIVVAITKVDKDNANPDLVKQQLAELELIPDEWDGDTMMIPIAALEGDGIDDLLEALILVAEEHDFAANPIGTVRGVVLESEVDKFKGTLATLLVMNGTLKVGDSIVAGTSYGRVKAMYDEHGKKIKSAPPSTPVSVLGLNNPPEPGDRFERVKNDKVARAIAQELIEEQAVKAHKPVEALSLEDIFKQFRAGQAKQLNLILKVDVQGSLQPIVDGLEKISGANEEGIQVRVLAADVGSISESDVMLASAGDAEADKAIIIAFNTIVADSAKKQAETHGVEIRNYNVIYKLFEDIELALEGMLDPKYEAKIIGQAEVRQIFSISRVGKVAGSYMKEGEAQRRSKARISRRGKVLGENLEIDALKRFNEDVSEVRTGFEFGVSFVNFNDIEEGDIIEFFVMERVR
ncbi:MAG: translation initiation factor IF-2 [Anaerolineae bacterium]|nr:translation initiation factor IF-2 [Anaerolineae bacterium]MDQ7035402.1 translation initiation factor IF-2 [Anaerolineae bacterium]